LAAESALSVNAVEGCETCTCDAPHDVAMFFGFDE
jgi:hypothetical protein